MENQHFIRIVKSKVDTGTDDYSLYYVKSYCKFVNSHGNFYATFHDKEDARKFAEMKSKELGFPVLDDSEKKEK